MWCLRHHLVQHPNSSSSNNSRLQCDGKLDGGFVNYKSFCSSSVRLLKMCQPYIHFIHSYWGHDTIRHCTGPQLFPLIWRTVVQAMPGHSRPKFCPRQEQQANRPRRDRERHPQQQWRQNKSHRPPHPHRRPRRRAASCRPEIYSRISSSNWASFANGVACGMCFLSCWGKDVYRRIDSGVTADWTGAALQRAFHIITLELLFWIIY